RHVDLDTIVANGLVSGMNVGVRTGIAVIRENDIAFFPPMFADGIDDRDEMCAVDRIEETTVRIYRWVCRIVRKSEFKMQMLIVWVGCGAYMTFASGHRASADGITRGGTGSRNTALTEVGVFTPFSVQGLDPDIVVIYTASACAGSIVDIHRMAGNPSGHG